MTSALGPPPRSSRVIDLEDAANSDNNGTVAWARNRLPVFRNLKDESSSIQSRIGRGSTARRTIRVSSVKPSTCNSVERPPSVPSVLHEESSNSVNRRLMSTDRYLCGGNCDGVTCIVLTASVNDAPCLKAEAVKEDGGGIRLPDLSGLPILDRLCPFHHHNSRWLVRSQSFIAISSLCLMLFISF